MALPLVCILKVKYWDTDLIKMLHSCDAGEYSVIILNFIYFR